MPMMVDWQLADPKILQRRFSNDPLGSPSFDSRPVPLGLESSPSFGGDDGAEAVQAWKKKAAEREVREALDALRRARREAGLPDM